MYDFLKNQIPKNPYLKHENTEVQLEHKPSTIFKIKLDGEVVCNKKFFPKDSLDMVRSQFQNDISVDYYFCTPDKIKIIKSDESKFHVSEISYIENSMNYINLVPNAPNISNLPNQPKEQKKEELVKTEPEIFLGKKHKSEGIKDESSNIQKKGAKQKPKPKAKAAPKHISSDESDNESSYDSDSDSNSDSDDSSESSSEEKEQKQKKEKKTKKKVATKKRNVFENFQSDVTLLRMDSMPVDQLNYLKKNLKKFLLDDLRGICRVNNIVHSGRSKDELIFSISSYIKDKKKFLKLKNNDLREILKKNEIPCSNLNKEEMIKKLLHS